MALKIESDALLSINPATQKPIDRFTATPPDDIPEIIQKVRVAFEHWSTLSLRTRLEFGKKAYRQFYLAQDEIAHLISEETGKPLAEAYSCEILPVLDSFKYYLKNIPRLLKDRKIASGNPLFKLRKGFVTYEPLGVVAVISAWNFPFLLAMQHVIPAILAGNAVIHKPSEQTTLTGLKVREIFDRAFLPKGVVEIVTGLADVGQALISADVDKIYFTGSTEVGRRIYKAAAENLVPVNLELGGSDPMIVLQDANLERAANAAIWGAFSNAGQTCLSVERLYVHESVMDEFANKLMKKASDIRLDHFNSNGGEMSCLANQQQFEKMERLVRDAHDKGAVIKLGGQPRKDLGDWYFEPTILTNVNSSMELSHQEMFGPVITLTPFITDDEAIYMANDSDFGLSASIWTENRKKGLKLARQIQAGSVLVNDLQIHIAQTEAPYTGYKRSGLGVSHGPWGVMELVRHKYINSDRTVLSKLLKTISKPLVNNDIWWFKYNQNLTESFRVFAHFLHGDTLLKRVKSVPSVLKAIFRKDYL